MMRDLHITQSITNRESKALETYLNELGKINLLTVDEEVALARMARHGDRVALEKLTKANLRFVVSVAKKYQHQGLSLGDLISEGNLGLIKAAGKFDETKGFKFISYAVWWIRQTILEAIAYQSRMIRLPLNQTGMISKLNKTAAGFEQQEERIPTPEELAECMNTHVYKILEAVHFAPKTVSYDAPLCHSDDDYALLDRIPGEETPADTSVLRESATKQLNQVLNVLLPRERQIIELSYGLTGERDMTPLDVGAIVGLTGERVRQLRNKALDKLRNNPAVLRELINN